MITLKSRERSLMITLKSRERSVMIILKSRVRSVMIKCGKKEFPPFRVTDGTEGTQIV